MSVKVALCNSFTLNEQLKNHLAGSLTCNRLNGVSVSVTAPWSHVTAKANLGNQVGNPV